MTVTIVETRAVTGGVDTHAGSHVAAALDPVGGLLGVQEFPGDRGWLRAASGLAGRVRDGVPGRDRENRKLWCRAWPGIWQPRVSGMRGGQPL